MKRFLATVAAAFVLPAGACPLADQLIDTYGISFSGFTKPLARSAPDIGHGARTADLVVIPLPNRKGRVPDGFVHSALIDTAAKRAWIHRRGGFAHVDEWYGPVRLERIVLEGCAVEPWGKR